MVKEEMHLKIKKLKKNIFHILILSYFVEVGGKCLLNIKRIIFENLILKKVIINKIKN
jgi:hypothetical protein